MAIEIKVPRLGWSMEEGTFIEWLKREGQPVQAGEPLFAIEGDKAIQEVESIGSGILRIPPSAPENGETVKVGQTLAFLVAADEADTFHATLDRPADATAVGPPASKDPRQAETSRPILPVPPEERKSALPAGTERASELERATPPGEPVPNRPRISPRAARLAVELGVDWSMVRGTGRNGRIRERDVRNEAAINREPALSPSTDGAREGDARSEASQHRRSARRARKAAEPLDPSAVSSAQRTFRRTIAARMLAGAQTTAPVTLTTTADATNLASLRAQFKATSQSPGELVPGYTDVVIKLVARALQEHPALNRQWIDGQIVSSDGVHIAVAVDTPAGLLAPVVFDVPRLGLRDIAARTHDLKLRAHASQLEPQELSGGTFTISNLGAFGIDAFTPIINVPQCAILGLGRIERRAMVVGEQIVPRETITLSLTFDHRVVDGAPAARFLASVRNAIENPGPWLVF